MESLAVVIECPENVGLRRLSLSDPGSSDILVEIEYSGISTGTERLLWSGRMPPFPGMGYPLVPGYESVGKVIDAGAESGHRAGDRVFVPGANCFGAVRGLFGGAAATIVTSGARARATGAAAGPEAILMALAATARHVLAGTQANPDLIVGHGILGRLMARMMVATGHVPTVWEKDPCRMDGGEGYPVVDPDDDPRGDYPLIIDASGDASLMDTLIGRLARGGEIVLAGFYSERVGFNFPPAFMREARLRVAAEWRPEDMDAVTALVDEGFLSLDGLITHTRPASEAPDAYATAFADPACLKMILDWRGCA